MVFFRHLQIRGKNFTLLLYPWKSKSCQKSSLSQEQGEFFMIKPRFLINQCSSRFWIDIYLIGEASGTANQAEQKTWRGPFKGGPGLGWGDHLQAPHQVNQPDSLYVIAGHSYSIKYFGSHLPPARDHQQYRASGACTTSQVCPL